MYECQVDKQWTVMVSFFPQRSFFLNLFFIDFFCPFREKKGGKEKEREIILHNMGGLHPIS